MEISDLAAVLKRQAGRRKRILVGIAGAPGSGKSTLADGLHEVLGAEAVVVPMDGFHFDDLILNARGDRPRKGAPHTFDVAGFEFLLKRIKAREADIAIPVFDRSQELSRAGASLISREAKFILVEGNYLLLKTAGWKKLKWLFDFTIFVDVPVAELERRLIARWLGFGFSPEVAREKALGNDIPNAQMVVKNSAKADLTV